MIQTTRKIQQFFRAVPSGNSFFDDKVYVVEFFFTTCPTICPRMSRNLVEIQDELRDMGIKINMNDLDKIDPEFRRNMCNHIVDRQLINFTDTRYEKIMKDTDI